MVTAEQLAQAFINDFWAANHEMGWLAVEEERLLWLDAQTLLIGKVDARGRTPDGEPFFGEWKTKSGSYAKRMIEVKATWRMGPQALTYGVLLKDEANRFTVRWMLKTDPPQTDFEWYTYAPEELAHWHSQLIKIGECIREWRESGSDSWLTNYGACFKYGAKYPCPHFANGCGILNFARPERAPARVPHTGLEAKLAWDSTNPLIPNDPKIVVLSSSRVSDYLECPEKYRRNWEGEGFHEDSEALAIGSATHDLIATHLKGLIHAGNN